MEKKLFIFDIANETTRLYHLSFNLLFYVTESPRITRIWGLGKNRVTRISSKVETETYWTNANSSHLRDLIEVKVKNCVIGNRVTVGDLMTVFEDLKLILETIKPREPDIDRPLFWGSGDPQDPSFGTHPAIYVASEFGTRFETGVDCDFVFHDSLLIGNL